MALGIFDIDSPQDECHDIVGYLVLRKDKTGTWDKWRSSGGTAKIYGSVRRASAAVGRNRMASGKYKIVAAYGRIDEWQG